MIKLVSKSFVEYLKRNLEKKCVMSDLFKT